MAKGIVEGESRGAESGWPRRRWEREELKTRFTVEAIKKMSLNFLITSLRSHYNNKSPDTVFVKMISCRIDVAELPEIVCRVLIELKSPP